MEIGGREDVFGVAEYVNATIEMVHKDVIVDAEILVVAVLVLASYLNRATVGE